MFDLYFVYTLINYPDLLNRHTFKAILLYTRSNNLFYLKANLCVIYNISLFKNYYIV